MTHILDCPISELELSFRASNCLINNGIHTLRDAVGLGEDGLLRIPNFGRKSINEINAIFQAYGLAKISKPRRKYLAFFIGDHVLEALRSQAACNDRSIESEAAILIAAGVGNPLPEASIPERIARIERIIAERLSA